MKLLIRASHSQVTWQHTPRKKPPQLAPSGSSPAVPQAASKWGRRNPLDFTNQQSLLNLDMSGPLVSLSS